MSKLLLYIYSLRYLKLTQILGRLSALMRWRILHRIQIYKAWCSHRATGKQQTALVTFPQASYPPGNLHDISQGTFTFLNRRVYLGRPINWFPQYETQLWIYNLHYFNDAPVLGSAYAQTSDKRTYKVFRHLVSDWIQSCPIATPLAWDPYPISLRISNWIKAYTLFQPALSEDHVFADELRNSLYSQACFLEKNLEYHLLGNHLIENGRALLLAGLFFQDSAGKRWRQKGERILWRELREQFLDDGGHSERSPMYHQLMLALYREVIWVLHAQDHVVPREIQDRVQAMHNWLSAVLHPDGEIPLLNDAAFGIGGCPNCVLEGTAAMPAGLKALPDSGYFVFRDYPAGNFLIFDCGPLGPDHQPGHGHCDTLSYELSLSGQRFIVDSGVGNYYGELDWRTYYRSTRAHNSIVVDGAEQSEIWGRFRVARRACPLYVRWEDQGSALTYVCGSHSGYRRLRGDVVHRRWMCWIDRRFWLVCDQVTGRGWHHLESLIHFHPEVRVVSVPDVTAQEQSGEVTRGQSSLKIIPWGVQTVSTHYGETNPIQGWYAPEFGLQIKNHVWGLRREAELPAWLGYVLWPEPTDIAVRFSMVDKQSGLVEVQAADAQYHIVYGRNEVKVEKDP